MVRQALNPHADFEIWLEGCRGRSWLDRYCSSPIWGLPLGKAFQPANALYIYRASRSDSLAIFSERSLAGGRLLLAPDAMWMLGSPLLGSQPVDLFQELLNYWRIHPSTEGVRQVLISGLYENHPLLKSEILSYVGAWETESSQRMVASLDGGVEGFMSRRSKNFRSRLRRMVKAADAAGIEIELMPETAGAEEVEAILRRCFAIEERSWKGLAGRGINEGGMKQFYQEMLPILAARGWLRGVFLTDGGQDVAYLFGGIFDGTFRGLQFSFSDERQLGLGNVCQYHMILRLVEEGCEFYDLGQAMEYKKRWAEVCPVSRSFIFQVG